MNLIICRNVLPYLTPESQQKALRALLFAMNPGAYLVLGASDVLTPIPDLQPIADTYGIYQKPAISITGTGDPDSPANAAQQQFLVQMYESCFDVSPVGHIVVDSKGALVSANAKARSTFGLKMQDLHRPLQDLEISYRPVELRSLIEQACCEKQEIQVEKVSRTTASGVQHFNVHIRPLLDANSQVLGTSIQFDDVTTFHSLHDDLQQLTQQLQTANEELQSAHEELETTNEELQSTNEELQTTNEELQSINEELETMNEELQSTNVELETTNIEQRELANHASNANALLESILSSMGSAVIVLNRSFEVLLWNERAADLWGLRLPEVKGANFFTLDIGLPVDQLRALLVENLDGQDGYAEINLEAINSRGKPIKCGVSITALNNKSYEGIVLLIDELPQDTNV